MTREETNRRMAQLDTKTKNAVIALIILDRVASGENVVDAFCAVTGADREQFFGEVYDALRAKAGQ